jgi:hypothetical protein
MFKDVFSESHANENVIKEVPHQHVSMAKKCKCQGMASREK